MDYYCDKTNYLQTLSHSFPLQGTDEWKALRERCVTSTQAVKAINYCEKQRKRDFSKKTKIVLPSKVFTGNVWTRYGNDKESIALQKYEYQYNDFIIPLNYLMHKRDNRWFIISVIANGVNDLSLKRAEYAAVIKDKGFEGLVQDITNKIQDMEKGTDE